MPILLNRHVNHHLEALWMGLKFGKIFVLKPAHFIKKKHD